MDSGSPWEGASTAVVTDHEGYPMLIAVECKPVPLGPLVSDSPQHDCPTHLSEDPAKVLETHEKEKKRKYLAPWPHRQGTDILAEEAVHSPV
jgi:hypothetical protein